ncbi:MAG: hypothetical protein AB7U98_03025 [Candidatus Nitrosocosmicus sp.]
MSTNSGGIIQMLSYLMIFFLVCYIFPHFPLPPDSDDEDSRTGYTSSTID